MRQHLKNIQNALSEASWLTRERLLRFGSALAFASLAVFALDASTHTMPGLTNTGGEPLGRDLVQFWSSARLAAIGHRAAAYIRQPHQRIDQVPYPPVVMLLCRPLAALPYPT